MPGTPSFYLHGLRCRQASMPPEANRGSIRLDRTGWPSGSWLGGWTGQESARRRPDRLHRFLVVALIGSRGNVFGGEL